MKSEEEFDEVEPEFAEGTMRWYIRRCQEEKERQERELELELARFADEGNPWHGEA
jgi:hypothetical protein